jgi:hypothetical protein
MMAGMHDGVSRIWVTRIQRGFCIDGYKDDCEAIDAIVRHALVFGPPETRTRLEAVFANAIQHLDEDGEEDAPPPAD